MEPCSAVGRSETLEEKHVRVEDGDISPVGSSEYRNDVAEVLGRIYDLLGLVNNKVEDVKGLRSYGSWKLSQRLRTRRKSWYVIKGLCWMLIVVRRWFRRVIL